MDDVGRIRSEFDIDNRSNGVEEDAYETPFNRLPAEQKINLDATTPSTSHLEDQAKSAVVLPPSLPPPQAAARYSNPRKRKLADSVFATSLLELENVDIAEHLPSQRLLVSLVEYFCTSFHHWIPYLHKKRLCDTVTGTRLEARSDLVLHALVAVTLRHMDRQSLDMEEDEILRQTKISRFIVETLALRTMSLESLQALVMIVFDRVSAIGQETVVHIPDSKQLSDGDVTSVWPLIGSLTRTVDYLQLTIEPSATQGNALMTPLQIVPPTQDFTNLEERRRLFWVVFLLDRFCSVSTGWNTSLTSEDVHRRLPADGGYFTREEPVTTPFFGIWSKAAGRIGRSLANVPAQYNEEDPASEPVQGSTPGSAAGLIDSSKLGAFAYCVEATESLSQVTTFFLQQRINWQDKEHAINWLTRFKELDLRLVQWKMFLPPRWKNSDISQNRQVVNMDPNLTLAHITHNTSMILLHHSIAYPPKEWSNYVALPKDCSAQTCQHAAVETANIVNKFLTHTLIPFVNVQFAFCTFIAAKVLLYEHQATRRPLRPEFERMKRNLEDMSRRWSIGRSTRDLSGCPLANPEIDQASRYAQYLEYLHDACRRNMSFAFDFYDHSCQRPGAWTLNTRASASVSSPPGGVRRKETWDGSGVLDVAAVPVHDALASPRTVVPARSNMRDTLASPLTKSDAAYSVNHSNPGYSQHAADIASPYPTTMSEAGYPPLNRQGHMVSGEVSSGNPIQDQSLLSLSDTLMDARFLDMDRVITFEDTNFYLPGDAYRW